MAYKKTIYTDLDTLFDTELVLLDLIDKRLVKEYFRNEHNIPNSILYLNDRDFKILYDARNIDIFKRATASEVDNVLRYFTSDLNMSRNNETMATIEIELVINTYPYRLSDVECNELKEFYNEHILYLDNVDVVYMEVLPTSYVLDLDIMVMKYGLEWFYTRKSIDSNFRSPTTRLVVPKRISNIAKLTRLGYDIEKLLEYVHRTSIYDIVIEFIDKESFMVKIPEDK